MAEMFGENMESTKKNHTRRTAEKLLAAFRAAGRIPDAWEMWSGYRRQVTDYIIENSRPGTSLAIFGAGRLNDFSLPDLLKHFSQVTLLDRDEEAMQEAVRREEMKMEEIGKCGCGRFDIYPVDFVGIAEEDYAAFVELLLQAGMEKENGDMAEAKKTEQEFFPTSKKAAEELSRIYAKSRAHVPKFGQENYDYTAAIGVHSQLGNALPWLLDASETCLRKTPKEKAGLLARMEQESAFLSERFNQQILSVTKQKAFIGCEASRAVCRNGVWYAMPDSAVSGAWQAIEDIKRRAVSGSIKFAHYLDIVWPFSLAQQKAYRMLVMEAEVK